MISLLLILSLSCLTGYVAADPDYLDALTKSIIFYEGQRSGKLDLSVLRDKWRGDSALQDGFAQGVRLSHVSDLCLLFRTGMRGLPQPITFTCVWAASSPVFFSIPPNSIHFLALSISCPG